MIFIVGLGIMLIGVNSVMGSMELSSPSDAIFGNAEVGTYTDQNDALAQSVTYFTCNNVGSMTDIVAYISGAYSGDAKAALYGDDGSLILQTNSVSVGVAFSWVDFQLPYPVTTDAGHTYGLAIMGDVPLNLVLVPDAGHRIGGPGDSAFDNGFTSPFGYAWFDDPAGGMSIYASGSTIVPTPAPTTNPQVMYRLTVNPVPGEGGTCSLAEPADTDGQAFILYANSAVGLFATPNSGYVFSDFVVQNPDGGIMHVTSNPYNFFIQSDMTVTVNFALVGSLSTPVPTQPPRLDTTTSGSIAIIGGGIAGIDGIALIGAVTGKFKF